MKKTILIAIAALLIGLSFYINYHHEARNNAVVDEKTVTIYGIDHSAGIIIKEINVWKNYETRSFAFTVRHGEKVIMLSRSGDAVKIKNSFGKTGYVTYWFIKELQ